METERILLRPWQDSDAEALFKYASDPDVGPRAGWLPHKSVEESLEIIRNVFSAEGMWAVIWKESGEAIGCVGYLPASASNLKNDTMLSNVISHIFRGIVDNLKNKSYLCSSFYTIRLWQHRCLTK